MLLCKFEKMSSLVKFGKLEHLKNMLYQFYKIYTYIVTLAF